MNGRCSMLFLFWGVYSLSCFRFFRFCYVLALDLFCWTF